MNEEDLKKAIEEYPIGTEFISPYSGENHIVKDVVKNSFTIHTGADGEKNIICKSTTNDGVFITYKGKWAEIIEPTKSEIINNYQIY